MPPNGWPLSCGRAGGYHATCRARSPARLKPAAVSFSGLLGGPRPRRGVGGGVRGEEIRRIVPVLERAEPFVVDPIGLSNAICFVYVEVVHVHRRVGVRLQGSVQFARPADVALVVLRADPL